MKWAIATAAGSNELRVCVRGAKSAAAPVGIAVLAAVARSHDRGDFARLAGNALPGSVPFGEGLDLLGVAQEGQHHRDTRDEENALHDMDAVFAEVE